MTATATASPATWRERPILFSGPMVRAILDGRKTQTRRMVKLPSMLVKRIVRLDAAWADRGLGAGGYLKVPHRHPEDPDWPVAEWPVERVRSPHGAPGDRLWVRETWGGDDCCGYAYRADHPEWTRFEGDGDQPDSAWRPSIYMPRQASRISLEITGVRVERLQDLSEEDARAEGVFEDEDDTDVFLAEQLGGEAAGRVAFMLLWDRINGKRAPWAQNPWVWVLTFRRLP